MKRLSFIATLAAAVALTVACGNKKDAADEVEADDAETMVDDAFTDVSLDSSLDSVSYAVGTKLAADFNNFNIIEQYGIKPEQMDAFVKGIKEACIAAGDNDEKARIAGIQIGYQLTQMKDNAARDIFNGDSTKSLSMEHLATAFINGIQHGVQLIGDDEAPTVIENYKNRITASEHANEKAKNEKFLAENKRRSDVITTASGLQYKVITTGRGAKPGATDRVKVHYEGRLIDGTVFDSSFQRGEPAVFGVNQVILGWQEALQMMPTGSEWEIYLPYNLAYGERGNSSIPPYATLIFTVKLLGIE